MLIATAHVGVTGSKSDCNRIAVARAGMGIAREVSRIEFKSPSISEFRLSFSSQMRPHA